MGIRHSFFVGACCSLLTIGIASAQTPEVFPLSGSGIGPTRPVVANLDGDSSNGLETVVTTTDGRIHAVASSGSVLWSATTPNIDCAKQPEKDKTYSSPAVGDLFGSGEQFVVVGYGGFRGKACDGGVAAYRGSTGERIWTFSIKSWSKQKKFFAFRHTVYATPTLADVDNDGSLEIGFGALDRNVYLLNANGSVRWYYNAADTVFSSPAFADVKNDAKLEMIIGTDITKNTKIRPPTQNGGFLYALDAGVDVPAGRRFLFRSTELQEWRKSFNQVIQSSPVIDDILPDSPGLEVVTGSGCFFPQGRGERRGKWYKVLSASSGRVLKTLSVAACTPTTPAVGDLDNDGVKEVVVSVSGAKNFGGDGRSHLIAWRPATDQVLWDVRPKVGRRGDALGGHLNRVPILRDLTGDGLPEVLVNSSTGVAIFNGLTGAQLTCDSSTCATPLLRTDARVLGSPAVADTNGDSILEILVLGRVDGQTALVRWDNPL